MGVTTSALADGAEYWHTPWPSNSSARYVSLSVGEQTFN